MVGWGVSGDGAGEGGRSLKTQAMMMMMVVVGGRAGRPSFGRMRPERNDFYGRWNSWAARPLERE